MVTTWRKGYSNHLLIMPYIYATLNATKHKAVKNLHAQCKINNLRQDFNSLCCTKLCLYTHSLLWRPYKPASQPDSNIFNPGYNHTLQRLIKSSLLCSCDELKHILQISRWRHTGIKGSDSAPFEANKKLPARQLQNQTLRVCLYSTRQHHAEIATASSRTSIWMTLHLGR